MIAKPGCWGLQGFHQPLTGEFPFGFSAVKVPLGASTPRGPLDCGPGLGITDLEDEAGSAPGSRQVGLQGGRWASGSPLALLHP